MVNDCLTNMFNKFGRALKIIAENKPTVTTKAFIQPLRYKDKSLLGEKSMDVGFFDDRNYLYIGGSDIRLDLYPFDTIIKTDAETFVVKRAQAVYLGERILYVWGIIQLYVEDSLK